VMLQSGVHPRPLLMILHTMRMKRIGWRLPM